jgi:hypothetical protein
VVLGVGVFLAATPQSVLRYRILHRMGLLDDGSRRRMEVLDFYSRSLCTVGRLTGQFSRARFTNHREFQTAIRPLFDPIDKVNRAYTEVSQVRVPLMVDILKAGGKDSDRRVCALAKVERYQWDEVREQGNRLFNATTSAWRHDDIDPLVLDRIRRDQTDGWPRLRRVLLDGAKRFAGPTAPRCEE